MDDFSVQEYTIMEFIQKNSGCTYVDTINHFDPVRHCNETSALIDHLIEKSVVSAANPYPDASKVRLYLTNAGISTLTAYREKQSLAAQRMEKELQETAENKAQQRFQNKIAVAQVLVPLVTFILGLIAEHFCGIIEFLFH